MNDKKKKTKVLEQINKKIVKNIINEILPITSTLGLGARPEPRPRQREEEREEEKRREKSGALKSKPSSELPTVIEPRSTRGPRTGTYIEDPAVEEVLKKAENLSHQELERLIKALNILSGKKISER